MTVAPIIPLALVGVEPVTTRAILVCEGACAQPTMHRYKDVTTSPETPDMARFVFGCNVCGARRVWGAESV